MFTLNEISTLTIDYNSYSSLYYKAVLLNVQCISLFTNDNDIIADHTLKQKIYKYKIL